MCCVELTAKEGEYDTVNVQDHNKPRISHDGLYVINCFPDPNKHTSSL